MLLSNCIIPDISAAKECPRSLNRLSKRVCPATCAACLALGCSSREPGAGSASCVTDSWGYHASIPGCSTSNFGSSPGKRGDGRVGADKVSRNAVCVIEADTSPQENREAPRLQVRPCAGLLANSDISAPYGRPQDRYA